MKDQITTNNAKQRLLVLEKEYCNFKLERLNVPSHLPWLRQIIQIIKGIRVDQMNARHEAELIEIITEIGGWPTAKEVGEEASQAAFRIALESELRPKRQKRFIEVMKRTEGVNGDHLACVIDRFWVINHKIQMYGTHTGTNIFTGESFAFPFREPEKVDFLRAEIGLPPIQV